MKRFLPLIAVFCLSSLAVAQETPPREEGGFRSPHLVELLRLDPTFKLDIRYATGNNFLGQPVYEEARAFLQAPAAAALVRVHRRLKEKGYGLVILDGYRPWYVTKLFWDRFPRFREYLADPAQGSRHNRGCAVDLTLYDLKTGEEVAMPSPFDDFTERAHPEYKGGKAEERAARDLLRSAMESEGFTVYKNEWWHFDYQNWRQYPILNLRFSEIREETMATFASVEEGGQILGSVDEYIERMSPLDRSIRMKTDRPVSKEEFTAFLRSNVLPWEAGEEAKIGAVLGELRDGLEKASVPDLGTITLIKTTGEEEGNGAYTRGRSIVLPQAMIRRPEGFLKRLLAHELFHLLSRDHPALRNALYETIGFRYCGEVAFPEELVPRKITNPDAVKNEHFIVVRAEDRPVPVVPIVYSTAARYDPGSRKGLFDYMELFLMAVDPGSAAPLGTKGAGGPLLFRVDQVSGFFEQVGRNTDYILHPEEILAENFALLVLGERDIPSPEIPAGIGKTLAAFAPGSNLLEDLHLLQPSRPCGQGFPGAETVFEELLAEERGAQGARDERLGWDGEPAAELL